MTQNEQYESSAAIDSTVELTKSGRAARRRVEIRLAARQARRSWTTSLLVIILIAIPIVPMTAVAVFLSSRTPTLEQVLTAELGSTETALRIVGGYDPSREQDPSGLWASIEYDYDTGQPIHPELPPPVDLSGLIPTEAELLQVGAMRFTVATPGGIAYFAGLVGDVADPRLEGPLELVDGRRPNNGSEAMVSPGALKHLNASVGDTLTLLAPAAKLTIVGVMKQATSPNTVQAVFVSADAIDPLEPGALYETVWYTTEWQPTEQELGPLNQAGVIAFARDLQRIEYTQVQLSGSAAWAYASMWMVGGTFAAYLVILLAGAGFAVSARRQQQSLAVAASVGADKSSVFRIVLLQGTVLGLVGGFIGAAIGLSLSPLVLNSFDDGSVRSYWGFNVPWWGIAGIVLFAVAIGTGAALMPARTATRGDVLASLRGSRKPALLRVSRPFWGSLLIAVGLAATVFGGLGLSALNSVEIVDYNDPMRNVYLFGIIAGPILFQVGIIFAGHWILSLIARAGRRFNLSARIATRDAAAHPGRVIPAFAAIAACVFLASAGLSMTNIYSEYGARTWWYEAPLGSMHLMVYGNTTDSDARVNIAHQALAQTNPSAIGMIHAAEWGYGAGEEPETFVRSAMVNYTDCDDHEIAMPIDCIGKDNALLGGDGPFVVTPEDLGIVLGISLDTNTLEQFAAGGAIVLDATYLAVDHVVINRWNRAEVDYYYQNWGQVPIPAPVETHRVDAKLVQLEHRLGWSVILSPLAADAIGFEASPRYLVASYDEPPAQEMLDGLTAASGNASNFSFRFEQGPPDQTIWLLLILAATGVLILGAGSVALGLARVERRPDDATLAAVGASPGVRRGIAFWQALVIVGIGTVTGTIAGLIPVWGIVMAADVNATEQLAMADTPWLWLVALAAGLPLLIAVVSWLIPPRKGTLTRRTAIG